MMRLGRRATLLVALSLLHLGRDKLRRGGVGVWNSGDLLAERLDPHRPRRDWHWSNPRARRGDDLPQRTVLPQPLVALVLVGVLSQLTGRHRARPGML